MTINIPFYKPCLPSWGVVEKDIKDMYNTGMLAPGKFTVRLEELVKEYLNVKHAIAFSNCSDAMMCLAAWTKKISGKNIAIVPGFTFAATWQAIDWNNMKTIVVDSDDEGLIDLLLLEKALQKYSNKIACVFAVHISGNPSHVRELEILSKKYGVFICYDAAHGFCTLLDGKPLGNNGLAEVFSIGTTKPVASGEGGIITTNNDDLAQDMYKAAMHGHKVGELDVELKSLNGRIQEFNSIIAYYGIKDIESNISKRREMAFFYNSKLPIVMSNNKITVKLRSQIVPRDSVCPSYKDYTVFVSVYDEVNSLYLDPIDIRDKLINKLYGIGIHTKRYYYPDIVNLTDVVTDINVVKDEFNLGNSTYLSNGCLSLPFYNAISSEEQKVVIDKLMLCLAEIVYTDLNG
jgi:dTDP-4-amino-4,6-dideoxygalactose transaminase